MSRRNTPVELTIGCLKPTHDGGTPFVEKRLTRVALRKREIPPGLVDHSDGVQYARIAPFRQQGDTFVAVVPVAQRVRTQAPRPR